MRYRLNSLMGLYRGVPKGVLQGLPRGIPEDQITTHIGVSFGLRDNWLGLPGEEFKGVRFAQLRL